MTKTKDGYRYRGYFMGHDEKTGEWLCMPPSFNEPAFRADTLGRAKEMIDEVYKDRPTNDQD